MTYRSDDDAHRAHIDVERRRVEAQERAVAVLREEVSSLARREVELGSAIAKRRGERMSGKGYLQLAGLVVMGFAVGAVSRVLQSSGHDATAMGLMFSSLVPLAFAVRAKRRRDRDAKALLERLDAGEALPATRVDPDLDCEEPPRETEARAAPPRRAQRR